MSEIEYAIVSNKAILRQALKITEDLLSDKKGTYGVTDSQSDEIKFLLAKALKDVFAKVPELK